MKKVFALLCALAIATPAYSADWVAIDDDLEIDIENIQKRHIKGKPYVGVWTRMLENGKTKHQN